MLLTTCAGLSEKVLFLLAFHDHGMTGLLDENNFLIDMTLDACNNNKILFGKTF